MCIKPENFNSYFNNLPIGAIHSATYFTGTYIRQLTDILPGQLKFSNVFASENTTATYYIDHQKQIHCSASEVHHLGNSIEEAMYNYPHLFI